MPEEKSRQNTAADLSNEQSDGVAELPDSSNHFGSSGSGTGTPIASKPAARQPAQSWPRIFFAVAATLFIIVFLGQNESVQLWWLRQQSAEELETTVKKNGPSPWPAYVLGLKYARQGRMQDAIYLLERARDGAPRSFDVRLTLGKAELFAGRLTDAILQLQEAAKLNPNDPHVYLFMGMAQRLIGRITDARQSEMKATGMDPKNPEAWYQYGICFSSDQGDESFGLPYLKRALDLQPENPVYQYAYGKVLADEQPGQFGEAIPHLQAALKLLPDNSNAWFLLGLCLHRNGTTAADRSEAVEALKHALKLKPGDRNSHYELGLIYEENGKAEEARKQYETAVKLDSSFAEVYFHLGRMADRTGKAAEAADARAHYEDLRKRHNDLEVIVKRIDANPRDISAHMQAARLMELQHSWKAATAQYMVVLELDPGNSAAKAALQNLRAKTGPATGIGNEVAH